MTTIFVGGHGRCNENMACAVPRNMSIYWFGKLGNPVSKRFSGAVLRGQLTVMSGMSSSDHPPCEHYTCESVAIESELRSKAFQAGPWNTDTYLIQARPDYQVPLSKLLTFAGEKWPGQKIEFKWAVCRSSVVNSGIVGHDFSTETGNAIEKARDIGCTGPSPAPGGQVITTVAGAIFLEKWGSPLPNYGKAAANQIKKTFGKAETSSGGYILV